MPRVHSLSLSLSSFSSSSFGVIRRKEKRKDDVTKKKGKRNRLNRNTDKLANDNVKGEREIKGWINRYADQGRGGANAHAYWRETDICRPTVQKGHADWQTKNGYADWRTKRIYRLAKIGSNKKKKKNKKRISRLAANRFADLVATGYWGYM